MKRAWMLIAFILAGLCAASAVRANDGIGEMEAGGLVFRHTNQIDMVSEDLYVSRERIRVRYLFRNRTRRPVRVIVGFPLPDHDLRADFYGDTAYPTDFHTRVGGRPVRMHVEYRAFWHGVEHTALLNRLRVPIMYSGESLDPIVAALSALPEAEQQRLLALGLVEPFDDPTTGHSISPIWMVKETWYWTQTFPAGRNLLVEHDYRPGAGGTHSTGLGSRTGRESDYGQAAIARYCIAPDFFAGVDRIVRRDGESYLGEHNISYILTTGAGWRSPIGTFRLVVDKERPNNLVSFCGEGVRPISPTRFEMVRRNWRPTRDLHVLILQPRR
jgi:hypothetical protein